MNGEPKATALLGGGRLTRRSPSEAWSMRPRLESETVSRAEYAKEREWEGARRAANSGQMYARRIVPSFGLRLLVLTHRRRLTSRLSCGRNVGGRKPAEPPVELA